MLLWLLLVLSLSLSLLFVFAMFLYRCGWSWRNPYPATRAQKLIIITATRAQAHFIAVDGPGAILTPQRVLRSSSSSPQRVLKRTEIKTTKAANS